MPRHLLGSVLESKKAVASDWDEQGNVDRESSTRSSETLYVRPNTANSTETQPVDPPDNQAVKM